jgi:hypothetical protein
MHDAMHRGEGEVSDHDQAAAIGAAGVRREREATIAFLLDRAEQYVPDSGYRAFIDELVAGIADGDHVERCAAGEYEDLYMRVQRIMRTRS